MGIFVGESGYSNREGEVVLRIKGEFVFFC